MRVLALTHVFPRFAADPSAPFLLTWAHALQSAGAEVRVLAPHDAGLAGEQDVAGVPVRLVRYAPDRSERVAYRGEMHQLVRTPSGPPLVASLITALAARVRGEIRDWRPDVLHVHWWVPGAIAARLARPSVPVVVTVHGTDVALIEGRPRLASVARWALARADRVEAVSADLAERLERATGRRADAVNPMPLDPACLATPAPHATPAPQTPAASPAQQVPAAPHTTAGPQVPLSPAASAAPDISAPPRILAVGRMVPEKGFADLLHAAALLDRPVTVELVGDGPELAPLRALAERLGLAAEFTGRLSPEELRAAYRRADVVAQPSHREGLGLVAAEAVLSGTPVVAADSGGVRDLLPADRLVPPRDPDALAARLAKALDDLEGERAATASLAGDIRGRLSPAASAARTLDGYGAVLGRP